jgi:hypothetical protein
MKTKMRFILTLAMITLVIITSCTSESPTPSPTDPRASFIGAWGVSENWNKLAYEVTITNDANSSTGVYIDNFANSGVGVKTFAIIAGSAISISPLPQGLSNGWVIESGSGYIQGTTKINWAYVFNDLATQYSATAVYTKK